MNFCVRRNRGVFVAESRLWYAILWIELSRMTIDMMLFRMCYVAMPLYICGFVLLGASFQEHLSVGALVMGWGISQVAIMINTVAVCKCPNHIAWSVCLFLRITTWCLDAYCNDCFPRFQVRVYLATTSALRLICGIHPIGWGVRSSQPCAYLGGIQCRIFPSTVGDKKWRITNLRCGGGHRRRAVYSCCSRHANKRRFSESEFLSARRCKWCWISLLRRNFRYDHDTPEHYTMKCHDSTGHTRVTFRWSRYVGFGGSVLNVLFARDVRTAMTIDDEICILDMSMFATIVNIIYAAGLILMRQLSHWTSHLKEQLRNILGTVYSSFGGISFLLCGQVGRGQCVMWSTPREAHVQNSCCHSRWFLELT